MLSTNFISFKTQFTEWNRALTGFYGSNWFGPPNSSFWGHPIFPGHWSRPAQFSKIRGNSFLFTSVESYPLNKTLFCTFLCPTPLWILLSRDRGTKEPQKTLPKKTQANQTHTDTQKTQSRTTEFHPHGFILPIPCRAERSQNPLGISKVSRFILMVSQPKFNKPYSAAQH